MNCHFEPFQPLLTHDVLAQKGIALEVRQPSDALKGIVHSYLQITTTKPTQYIIMPDGMEAFYISPQGVKVSRVLDRAVELDIKVPDQYFGIRFYAGGLNRFFKTKADCFSSEVYDASEVFKEALNLHAPLYQCSDFSLRADFCDNWLINKLTVEKGGNFRLLSPIFMAKVVYPRLAIYRGLLVLVADS